jgi:hypothetical protein
VGLIEGLVCGLCSPTSKNMLQREEQRMPHMFSFERIARIEELLAGIELCLEIKFGVEGLELMPEIRQFTSVDVLRAVLKAIPTAATPEEVARPWWDPKSWSR